MTAPPFPPQPHRARPHRHTQRPIALTMTTLPIALTVMPAQAGIQHLGSCGVRS